MNIIVKTLVVVTTLVVGGCGNTLQNYILKDYVPTPSPRLMAFAGTGIEVKEDPLTQWIVRPRGQNVHYLTGPLVGGQHECEIISKTGNRWEYISRVRITPMDAPEQMFNLFTNDVRNFDTRVRAFLGLCNRDYLPAGPGSTGGS